MKLILLAMGLLCAPFSLNAQSLFQDSPFMNGVFSIKIVPDDNSGKVYGFDKKTIANARKTLAEQTVGSGFIVEYQDKQYLITCAHVVETHRIQAGAIKVMDANRKQYAVKIIGGDTFYDIAVLEFLAPIPDFSGRHVFKLREKPIAQGLPIQSLGNTSSQQNIVRSGSVGGNAENLTIEVNEYGNLYGYFETESQFNKGMSGGPLVDSDGRLVGINALMIEDLSQGETHRYALRGDIADNAIRQVIDNPRRRIDRNFLGLVFQQEGNEKRRTPNRSQSPILIKDVLEGTPAAQFRNKILQTRLLKINGKPIVFLQDIYKQLEFSPQGASISLTVETNGQEKTIQLQPELLNKKAYTAICKHYFDNNPNFFLEQHEYGLFAHKRSCRTHSQNKPHPFCAQSFEVSLAGFSNGKHYKYYMSRKMHELGLIVKLCSEFGGIRIKSLDHNEGDPIWVENNDNIYSSKILRLLYY